MALGRIRLETDELVLETMSRERNARGRAMLEDALGALIAHRADSIEDPEVAMRRHSERGAEANDEVPEVVQREVVGQYLRDYYRRWLDEPIPALGGKSPRKAARTKRGRAQVDDLLKEIENGTSGQPGGDTVDFAAMRHELGLGHPPTELERYDANEPPASAQWLAHDESMRILAVEAHHRELAAHPDMPNPRLHALTHVIVENQLAVDQPGEVRPTLERLLAGGLTRHEAIHAIGSVVAEQQFKIMKERTELDRDLVARSLARLRPELWRFPR